MDHALGKRDVGVQRVAEHDDVAAIRLLRTGTSWNVGHIPFHCLRMCSVARSAIAAMVLVGLRPTGTGMMAPSITYRPRWPNTWPKWFTTPSFALLPMLQPPRG